MSDREHPRLRLPGFLSSNLCKELEFVHKSCSTVGYRPNVFSTTLSHLIATNSSHLVIPFIPIRERVKEKVEEFFGCEFELFIEFTGLISWCKGASIGWHSDDNRPYLVQRHFAAVCYLNSHGNDFKGGLFHFQDGEPTTIVPMTGDVVVYTADSRNIHAVDEITAGERLTLTMWFTRDSSHDEDAKLVTLFSQMNPLRNQDVRPDLYLPLPAPSNMYWFSPDSASNLQSGFDMRWARVHLLGFDIYTSHCKSLNSKSDPSFDPSELHSKPLKLGQGDQIFEMEFKNSLHALQVAQFLSWNVSKIQSTRITEANKKARSVQTITEEHTNLQLFSGDSDLAEIVLGYMPGDNKRSSVDWDDFLEAVTLWDDYVRGLWRELMICIPQWVMHQTIFFVELQGE